MMNPTKSAVVQAPSALLTMGDYYGSLAATRCLGAMGIKVEFAEHRRFVPARWSRHVTQLRRCPDPLELGPFLGWLTAFGRRHPGSVLYPTSDDMAYLLSTHRDELALSFQLYQPPRAAVMMLLDKFHLGVEAAAVGLSTPETAFITSERGLAEVACAFQDGVLVKPRTQVGLRTKGKGRLCTKAADVAAATRGFLATETYDPLVLRDDPSVAWPMLQRFYPSAASGMLSVAGFVAADGQGHCMMASEKVFQRPRRLGVGVAFEARPLPPDLRAGLLALCRRVGYFGVFEAEFIADPDTRRQLLVDFNPRYYGQMGFEIARGMRLPLLAYYGASGQAGKLDEELAAAVKAMASPVATNSVYALAWSLKALVVTQRLGGRMARAEAQRWRQWLADPGRPRFDAVADGRDWCPAAVDQGRHWLLALRHPRDFYRKFFLDA